MYNYFNGGVCRNIRENPPRVLVSSGWWLEAGVEAAYLGAVCWVVYNSCLGFLGGGRRHFTMQGVYDREGVGTSKRCQGIS